MDQKVIRVEDVIPTRRKLVLAMEAKRYMLGGKLQDAETCLIHLVAALQADLTIEEITGG